MIDSGHQVSHGYLGSTAHDTYKAMVDAELARPPQAEIEAAGWRLGNRMHFDGTLTNLSGVTLSSSNSATIHALVYEEHTPVDPSVDHVTGRIVRAAVSTGVSPALVHGATMTFTLDTSELSNVVDWTRVHAIVLVDYQPADSGGAYDMLQAVSADATPALTVSKRAFPDPAQAGKPLTYTICVTNVGHTDLHATVTDTLPAHVTPAGVLNWTPTITAPGGIWEHTFVVTVEAGYIGALVNQVEVTTEEGAIGTAVTASSWYKTYLPMTYKDLTATESGGAQDEAQD